MHGDRTEFVRNEYVQSLSEDERNVFWRIISKPFCKVRPIDNIEKLVNDGKIVVFDGWAITTAYYFFHRKKWKVRILKRIERHNAYETLVSLEKHGKHWEAFLKSICYGKITEVAENIKEQKPKEDVPTQENKSRIKKTPEQLKSEFLASF